MINKYIPSSKNFIAISYNCILKCDCDYHCEKNKIYLKNWHQITFTDVPLRPIISSISIDHIILIFGNTKFVIFAKRTGSQIFSHVTAVCSGWIAVCSLCRQTSAYCRIGLRPWIVSLWDVTSGTRVLCRMWAHSNVKAWFYGSLSRDEKRATLATPIEQRRPTHNTGLDFVLSN